MLIVFIGPDGCGKTTVANAVVSHLSHNKAVDVRFFELNFGVLPRFRDVAALIFRRSFGKNHTPGERLGGMKAAPNSPFRAGFYILWYALDYILGGLLHRKAISDGVVVFARYSYDYGYQRSYKRAPRFMRDFMIYLSPRPDLVFTIDREADEIFRMKPELDVNEIRVQQEKIAMMLSGNPRFHILDGRQGIQATVARALSIIEKS